MNKLQENVASWIRNKKDFAALLATGMFHEYFPECDGTWENFNVFRDFKKEEE